MTKSSSLCQRNTPSASSVARPASSVFTVLSSSERNTSSAYAFCFATRSRTSNAIVLAIEILMDEHDTIQRWRREPRLDARPTPSARPVSGQGQSCQECPTIGIFTYFGYWWKIFGYEDYK